MSYHPLTEFTVAQLRAELERRADCEDVPALIVHADAVECPHCGARDSVTEVDRSTRRNDIEATIENGRITRLAVTEADSDHQHQRYECGTCEREITIPGDIEPEWS